MRCAGAEVWVDHKGIRGGDNLPEEISNALQWCNTVVLVWSEAASSSYWVKLEWTNALSLQKKIIPCRVDRAPLPAILAHKAFIDFLNISQGVDELKLALDIADPESVLDKIEYQLKVPQDQQINKSLQANKPPQQRTTQSVPNSVDEVITLNDHRFINGICTYCGASLTATRHFNWSCQKARYLYTGYHNGHDFVNGVCKGCAKSYAYYSDRACQRAQHHYTGYYYGHDFVDGVCQACGMSKEYCDHFGENCEA